MLQGDNHVQGQVWAREAKRHEERSKWQEDLERLRRILQHDRVGLRLEAWAREETAGRCNDRWCHGEWAAIRRYLVALKSDGELYK